MIIGKLIPAGTGLERYRNIRVEPTEEARAAAYSVTGYDSYDYEFGTAGGPGRRAGRLRLRVRTRTEVDRPDGLTEGPGSCPGAGVFALSES